MNGANSRHKEAKLCPIARAYATITAMTGNPAHTRAIGQLLLAAFGWSIGGLLIKWIEWPPLAVASGRGLIAALFLIVFQRGLRFTWSPVQLGAALAYALTTLAFVSATKLTTAANAILLQYT